MDLFQIAVFFNFVALAFFQDPCLEENHVLVKDAFYRSTGFMLEEEGIAQHDRFLQEGWYRFDSMAGSTMPTEAPELNACGTLFPIWLDVTQTVQGPMGVHTATACVVSFGGECGSTYNIKLKECTGFTVYYLVPTEAATESYCIGKEVECPDDTSSDTGFTPNCVRDGFPIVEGRAEITYKIDDGNGQRNSLRKVVMLCNLVLDQEVEDIFFDVYWYFNSHDLIISQVREDAIPIKDLPAALSEDVWAQHGGIGQTISCKLRPRFAPTAIAGRPLSADYYMGFVTTTSTVTVEEGGDPSKYKFYSTIPILTPVGHEQNALHIDVLVPKIRAGNGVCAATDAVIEYDITECGVKIPYSREVGPDVEFSVNVHAVTDATYDGDHKLVMKLKTAKRHPFHEIWSDKELPSVTVVVIDKDVSIKGAYCKSRDDPHMTTFDGRIYENQLEGEFIMFRHTALPIEVQAYYRRCNSYATCNCGAAVRAGGDLFIYDYCRPGKPLRQRLYSCKDEALSYVYKNGAYEVTIIPTGMIVRMGRAFVEIYPSPRDYMRAEGLCGTFDTNCANDFQLRDGTYSTHAKANRPSCDRRTSWDRYFHPNDFSNSWRVKQGESLYRGEIPEVHDELPSTIYCDCSPEESTGARCHRTPFTRYCTQPQEPAVNECINRRRKREAGHMDDDVEEDVEMFEFDATFTPPPPGWKNEWTEDKARSYCVGYLENRTSTQTCLGLDVVDIEAALTSCEADIWLSGDVSFSAGHLEDILNSCESEVKKNVTYFIVPEVEEEGEPPKMPPVFALLENVCPSDCSGHGTCVENQCQCAEDYTGDDCSLEVNKVPMLYDIQFGGLCDLQTRPCEATPVHGDSFIASENLKCKLTPVTQTTSGEQSRGHTTIVNAEYVHENKVMCPLYVPELESDDLTYSFEIALTNDAVTYSDAKLITIYNSGCMQCSKMDSVQCVLNETSCYIERVCYEELETEVGNPCHVCSPVVSQLSWTKDESGNCESNASGRLSSRQLLSCLTFAATIMLIFKDMM